MPGSATPFYHHVVVVSAMLVYAALAPCSTEALAASPIDDVAIVLDPDATRAEQLAAAVLKRRLLEITAVGVEMGHAAGADLEIHLGTQRESGRLHDLAERYEVALPERKGLVFPEGFAMTTVAGVEPRKLIAVGADDRGTLYAAGEILRRLRYFENSVELPEFTFQSAPAFRYRGSSANQGGTMMKITKARGWTEAELHGVVLEYALAGGNTFYASDRPSPFYDFMKSHGFMTVTGARPNQFYAEFPPEWKAAGREAWEGDRWACPSVPEARAALLKQWDEDFSQRAFHEVMRFYAGDPGGCTCEKCTPWGKTFVHLSEEMAAIWLKYHPSSTVQIANQGLDNAGDLAILAYLNEQPRTWCYGICYGPGSNAMSPYFRDIDMRDDLFAYAGHGPVNRYLSELHRGLPLDQRIVHYSDITHYISAQFAAENPELNLVRSYGRRTFHARPVAMYRTFQAIMPFSEGDIIYSEGNHDEFHQYLWNRMLWDPNRTLDDLMLEYCTLHFGEAAAPMMVQALYQLEHNLEASLAENEGIQRYYDLVREAGQRMPAWRMDRDWRWRLHMQKAALDCYNQQKLRIELDKETRVRDVIEGSLEGGKVRDPIGRALEILNEPSQTDAMLALKDEARVLGDETDKRHGDRNPGYFRLDQQLRDLDGIKAILEKANQEKSRKKQRELLRSAIEETRKATRRGNIFW